MDINALYFEHQLLLMKAEMPQSSAGRRHLVSTASGIAGHIGNIQEQLGASGAPEWQARASALK